MDRAVAVAVGVEVWRGQRIESRHRVSLCVSDAAGQVVLGTGDLEQRVYPRSAIKPFQALPLVESGAADAFRLSQEELALACASHGGEPMHVERVAALLGRLGLDQEALACGPHPPSFREAADDLVRAGRTPGRIHNNCSGKHTGMLATALHLGASTRGYEQPGHPVQERVAQALRDLTGIADLGAPGTDGCGVPTWAIPLRALALAFARLADPAGLPEVRIAATRRIGQAMRRHPELVAGTGRCCTAMMQALPQAVVKTGAEGVYAAALPDRGLGVVLKVEDGAGRAAEVAIIAALGALGEVGKAAADALAPFARPTLRNYAGTVVGRIAPADGWPAQGA
jgi:L-asparaginase II